jgi:hypothetical protein
MKGIIRSQKKFHFPVREYYSNDDDNNNLIKKSERRESGERNNDKYCPGI